MKKYLIILVCICFFNCEKTKPKDILIEKAENELKKTMHDPSSYQFVSFEIDTLEIQNAKLKIKDLEKILSKTKEESEISVINDEIESVKSKYGNQLTDNTKLKYKLKYRGKNMMGALILNDIYVVASNDEDLRFIALENE